MDVKDHAKVDVAVDALDVEDVLETVKDHAQENVIPLVKDHAILHVVVAVLGLVHRDAEDRANIHVDRIVLKDVEMIVLDHVEDHALLDVLVPVETHVLHNVHQHVPDHVQDNVMVL